MDEQQLKELLLAQFDIEEKEIGEVVLDFQEKLQGSDFETAFFEATKNLTKKG